jgi:sugar phosphate isomerase/epimerase
MAVQFGMPTLIEIKSLESCAALCRELGLSFVELSMDMPEYQPDRLDLDLLREVADKYGIYYTIHLSGFLNPCDFNSKVASAYTETALETIEIAKQLAVPIVNMHLHPGDHFTLPDKKVCLFDVYKSEYLNKLTAFRDACTAAIGGFDVQICVENCGDYGDKPYLQKGLALLLQSSVFALTFDVGHNAGAGYTDEPTIMKHADRLAHFHIHDASGRNNHLILGEGDMDLKKYLDLAMAHDCRAVIEIKTVEGLRKSVDWLKAKGWL